MPRETKRPQAPVFDAAAVRRACEQVDAFARAARDLRDRFRAARWPKNKR